MKSNNPLSLSNLITLFDKWSISLLISMKTINYEDFTQKTVYTL